MDSKTQHQLVVTEKKRVQHMLNTQSMLKVGGVRVVRKSWAPKTPITGMCCWPFVREAARNHATRVPFSTPSLHPYFSPMPYFLRASSSFLIYFILLCWYLKLFKAWLISNQLGVRFERSSIWSLIYMESVFSIWSSMFKIQNFSHM